MSDSKTVTAWMEALTRIERSVVQSLRHTADPPAKAGPAKPGEIGPLEKLDVRLNQWQACLEQVERTARSAEQALDQDQSALADWLSAVSASKARLDELLRRET